MKIIIADDHVLFRDALGHYIERSEPDAEIRQVDDFHGVMDLLHTGFIPDLVMLDLRMPGMNGLGGLQKLRDLWPDLSVILLSGLAERADVHKALDMGVMGYFPKTLSGKLMFQGVYKVLHGEKFIPIDYNTNTVMASNYDDQPMAAARPTQKGPPVLLTPREREVLGYLLRGVSNKEIALALNLQVVTVKLHVRGVCRKLGAKNRTQAALMAQQRGIV